MEATTLYRSLEDAGLVDREAAEQSLRATLAVLGERLTVDESTSLGAALPAELRAALLENRYDADFDAAELFERVRRRTGEDAGLARERTQIVCAVLGELMPPDVALRMRRHLPPDFASLFEWRAAGDAPPHEPSTGHGRSLATGRAGSRHPLAESAPPIAQSHSVVREDNPHGETKLSSARGMTQERLDESLSTGQPGPAHTIAEAHDTSED